jgi:hypothetical protein
MRRFPICAASLERAQSRLNSPVAPGPALTVQLRWMVQVRGAGRHVLRAAVAGAYSYLWRKGPRGSVPTTELRIERWWRLMPWTHRQRAGVDLNMGAAETRHLVPERLGRACN